MPLAERAFEARVRTALLNAAEARAVPLLHPLPVDQVCVQVVLFYPALFARANRFVLLRKMGVVHTEVSPAVLAGMLRCVEAAGESSAELAHRRAHRCSLIH